MTDGEFGSPALYVPPPLAYEHLQPIALQVFATRDRRAMEVLRRAVRPVGGTSSSLFLWFRVRLAGDLTCPMDNVCPCRVKPLPSS